MHFGSYGCDSPLTLKARCLGVYLTCIFHELGYLMWGSNPVLHREKPWVLSSLLIVDITSRMKFLVRLCLSFSYLLCYFIFEFAQCVGVAQVIFMFFPEEVFQYVAADSVYSWDEVSSGSSMPPS